MADHLLRPGPAARSLLSAARLARTAVIALFLVSCLAAPGMARVPEDGFAELVQAIAPAVVNISTSRSAGPSAEPAVPMPQFPPGSPFEDFFRDFLERERGPNAPPRPSTSMGSGFVVHPNGFVVTNNHVVGEADQIEVTFNDDRSFQATLIGRDSKTDLALLKIDGGPFPHVEFADSETVRVGDWVVAIGNPFGLGSSVTAGIISARGRDIRSGPYDDFIQVDAPINRGNSGGPSFNLDGKVIGVNTAIFSPSGGNVGIGFAIPANLAKPVIDSLMRYGTVKRGWLGVRIQSVTDEIAESMNLPEAEGALVANVTPGGPAEQAQLRPGDVILSFDGKKVERMRSLPRIVAETPIDREVDVVIWREGRQQDVRVTVGELPEEEVAAEEELEPGQGGSSGMEMPIEPLGITVAMITPESRQAFRLAEDAQGVVVTAVEPGGAAAQENLQPGDLIVEVSQEQVGSPPEVLAKVEQARDDDKRSVLVLVNRQGDLRFVALKLAG
ncbi:DegQ family serine endoprotease [Marinivivus vitaminiproducens]|uniref:DegQ family serine endoprotease n=1 Tax=Marinivivus vitaminiproducens TaxID=3035935 RepID=UPI0027A0C432|nr:DegQ family serine endoprotease [Geminicoccaceae bacterium SCSIO 64248]